MQPLSGLLTMSDKVRKGLKLINVGISNRHIHLSARDRDILFGKDYKFTYIKSLSQKGQFAAKETVTLIGLKDSMENVRILGPERKHTQVEISRTDMYKLGVNAPVRDSGDIEGSPGIILLGPKGIVELKRGVICAKRHIHMNPEDAAFFNLKDKENVWVRVDNERGLIFGQVLVRVHESFSLEFHVDTDEANSAGLKNNDKVEIIEV